MQSRIPLDIDGLDAAHKIGLLASIAYGTSLPPKDFFIEGITEIDKQDFIYADMLGYTIKHLAISKLNSDSIELRAHPALIQKSSYLANLKGVRNGITEVDTDLIGTIHIAGSGSRPRIHSIWIVDIRYYSFCKL